MVEDRVGEVPCGEPRLEHEQARWFHAQEAMKSLHDELTDWALLREKVLDKLDLKAACRARQLSFELRSLATQPDDLAESEDLAELLAACDALLEQRAELGEETPPPPDSGIVSYPNVGAGLPVLHDDRENPEDTAPGSRRAAAQVRAERQRRCG